MNSLNFTDLFFFFHRANHQNTKFNQRLTVPQHPSFHRDRKPSLSINPKELFKIIKACRKKKLEQKKFQINPIIEDDHQQISRKLKTKIKTPITFSVKHKSGIAVLNQNQSPKYANQNRKKSYFISPETGTHDLQKSAFFLVPKKTDVSQRHPSQPSMSTISANALLLLASSSSAPTLHLPPPLFLGDDTDAPEFLTKKGLLAIPPLLRRKRRSHRAREWKKRNKRNRERRDSMERHTGMIRPLAPDVSSPTGKLRSISVVVLGFRRCFAEETMIFIERAQKTETKKRGALISLFEEENACSMSRGTT